MILLGNVKLQRIQFKSLHGFLPLLNNSKKNRTKTLGVYQKSTDSTR